MRIWKKIILGFIAVIVIMMIVDYNALRNNIQLIDHVDDLELSKRVELNESNKIAYVIQRIKSNLRESLLEIENEKDSEDESEHLEQEIERAKQVIIENMDVLSVSLKTLYDATQVGYHFAAEDEDQEREKEELAMIDSLTSKVNQFTFSLEQILKLQEELKYEEAEELFENDAEPISREIQYLVEAIVEDAQEEVDWAITQLDVKVNKVIQLGVYLTILSILLSLSIGFYIARSISNPLNKLIIGTHEVSKGNLDTSVELHTKGELQALADSFNIMAKELKIKITSINQLNKELEESNNTKDTFFSIIGHDLKNPFNSILGFTELLEKRFDEFTDNEKRRMISEVNKSAGMIYEMLENLLTWALSQSGKIRLIKEPLKLSAIVQKSIESYEVNASQKNIQIKNMVPEVLQVVADRYTLIIVVNNIINNAIKFTKDGGKIEIYAQVIDDKVELSIKDTGIGMSQETIDKLFVAEKIESSPGTNNEVGTGLGLSLVKDFIEKNGGQLWVKSEIGIGSEFRFSLPTEPS